MNINRNLRESDIDDIHIETPSEQEIQNHETKGSEWRFQKSISMPIHFYKSTELNGSNFLKISLSFSAILTFQIDDKYCFVW